jgi:hypothetical protein
MAGNNSDYLEARISDWLKGTAMPAAPSALYIGLFNGDPTDAGTGGTEVTTLILTSGRMTASFTRVGGVLTSNSAVDFGGAAGAATISHFGIFDAAAAGNLLMYGPLTGGVQSVESGVNVSFAAGDLTLTQN